MSILLKVLISIDQLGNVVLLGGSPDNTISAQCHHNHKTSTTKYKMLWSMVEKVIDCTFEPLDGKGHCKAAYEVEVGHDFSANSERSMAAASMLVVAGCMVLMIPIRIIAMASSIIKKMMK